MADMSDDRDQAADEDLLNREISDVALEAAAAVDLPAARPSMINSLMCDPLHC
jgi:hypothetical protein